ncbi:IS30 family transposase [Maribacter sp. 2307ULW6-5]|uniref:IS30 family transposase n=1 Tax=Maribacter sp. 2307ULW6-5 TaxID=3386275 RepID=UPI0039BC4FE7
MMKHLTLGERYEISIFLGQGVTMAEIARKLGRSRSTISREVKRNADGRSGRYRAELAQGKSCSRHSGKNKHGTFDRSMEDYVASWLKKDLSPEQIKGLSDKNGVPCVSAERIYQFVWQDKKQGGTLYLHLRTKGRKYVKRGDKKAGRGLIPNRTDISQRPAVVERKDRIGDLEIDLVMGKGQKGALLTINDRATGTLKMAHVAGKGAKDIEIRTKELLEDWRPFIKTITSDNGKEFSNHQDIAEELNIDFYFATPYHSWERGANENLNGLVRQYFPKGSNFNDMKKEAVEKAENILNNRPRKRFGYRTPNEVFAAAIENQGIVAFMT